MNSAQDNIKAAMAEVPRRLETYSQQEASKLQTDVDRFLENLPTVIRGAADHGMTNVPLFTGVVVVSRFHTCVESELRKLGLIVDWVITRDDVNETRLMTLVLKLT